MHIASCQMVVSESGSMVRVAQHLVLDLPRMVYQWILQQTSLRYYSRQYTKRYTYLQIFHLCIFAHRIPMMPELLKVV